MKSIQSFLLYSSCIILLLFSNLGCRKACRFVRLPKMEGGEGYGKLTSAEIPGKGFQRTGWNNYDFIITNTADYDSIFNSQQPCGNVDFNSKIILVACRYINPNSGMESNSNVYVNTTTMAINFKVNYSLKDQCDGSGISSYGAIFYAVIPKAFNSYQMIYEIKDINPF